VLVLAGGCAGSAAPKRSAVPASATTAADETPEPPVPPARGHQVASLDRRTLGPFTSRDAAGGLVAWVVPRNRGEGQDLVVVPTAPDGAAVRGAQAIAQVPSEATSLIVQPAGGKQRGWLVAWSALLDRGESLSVLGVTPDGAARGTPTDVQRTSDHVKWAALVPTPRGALCLWAEQTAMDDANLFANALEPDGKARGLPVRIARGVVGWQALPTSDGAALALVSPVPLGSNQRADEKAGAPRPAGTLAWLRLDADGHALGNPTVIAGRPTVGSDVDVVARDGGWLLAWTDRTGENSQIMTASVDEGGAVKGPAPALPDVGGSSLVGLASASSGALVAWVEPHGRKRVEQNLDLALVPSGALAAQPLAALRVATSPMPEVVGSGPGFGLLASARVCKATEAPGRACAGPFVPTFVRLGPHLDAVQTEPLFVGQGGTEPAAVAWQLQCLEDGRCTALAAPGNAPTPVFAMDLPPRTSPFAPPLPPALPPDAPRVSGVATVASGAPFEDVAAAQVGDSTVVAALAPIPDARPAGGVARVTLRALEGGARPLGPVRTMSSHAVPVGGIAMASGAAEDGAALAWVARDDGDAAVHLARLDRAAHATREVRLSPAKSDASDVAVAWAGDGWVVAWVDAREGNGEVYATKVDRDLKRVGRDERITSAPGDAGGVSLATAGDLVWVAWSDPRDNPRDGLADVFVATLGAKDGAPVGREARVLATAAHSRSPQLVAVEGGGAMVGWIEDAPPGIEGPGAALIARLEPGPVVGPSAPLPLAPGERPSSITFVPEPGGARIVVAHPTADVLSLDALRVDAGGRVTSRPTHLLDLDAPAVFEPSLALAPGALFYVDVGLAGGERSSHRVRRATVSWTR
jgi:hypothetical protein